MCHSVIQELKLKCSECLKYLLDHDLFETITPHNFIASIKETIELLASQQHLLQLDSTPVACTFVNNLSAFVDRPLCTVPRILLQCYCNCLSNLL